MQQIFEGNPVKSVAVVGSDYVGMKPTMEVQVGDVVKLGQVIFSDKKTPGVKYTAPGAGTVTAINRGYRRALESVVIELKGDDAVSFQSWPDTDLSSLSREEVQNNLIESGQWTALRTRPFSKVPSLDSTPRSIFVQAIDTNPLAADPTIFLNEQKDAFIDGLKILTRLTDGPVFLCKGEDSNIPGRGTEGVVAEEFAGPHPAGLPGTHIHFLDPVNAEKEVWTINYQDVIAFGHLFRTGKIYTERVISLAGPQVIAGRLLRTRMGASLNDLTTGQLAEGNNRVISGSVLSGRAQDDNHAWLGRYQMQISVILDEAPREFLGWMAPGAEKYSIKPVFISRLFKGKKFAFNTDEGGSKRAMVPVGSYEAVMPLDIIPTFLLRAIITKDTDQAQQLGVLELDEEDVALCTFVCPGKYEYGNLIRENLTIIEKDG